MVDGMTHPALGMWVAWQEARQMALPVQVGSAWLQAGFPSTPITQLMDAGSSIL